MVSATSVELAEWICLLIIAVAWAIIAWLVNAARILRTDTMKEINKKHKETRLSSTLSHLAVASLLIAAGILIVWTGQADTTKDGGAITVQFFRWIGIGLFLFFLSWAYANYSGLRETDWRILQIQIFFGGLAGTLATLVVNDTKLQIVAYVFTAFFYFIAAINAIRYTNIKPVGLGWNYLAWLLIYVTAPFIFFLLLVFGPEGTKVENNRGLVAIGYLVVSVSHAILPGLIIALTFLATRKISMDVITAMFKTRKVAVKEMGTKMDDMVSDDLFDLLNSKNA